MNTVLWIIQGLIAAMFAMTGFMKLSKSRDEIKARNGMNWAENVSGSQLKLIGLAELLAAIGLIIPQLTGILLWMTPLAAIGLILIMVGAMVLHKQRGDGPKPISLNIMLMLLATYIAFGRLVFVPA
jgi:uncharacterized membrane protein YphA (DoxX/SURF4 family)